MIVEQPIGKKAQTMVGASILTMILDFSAAAGVSSPGSTPPVTAHLPPYVGFFNNNVMRPMGGWR